MSTPPSTATNPKRGLAIASLGFGVFSLLLGIISGIPAAATGLAARRRSQRQPEVFGGRKIATAGLTLGLLSPLVTTVHILTALAASKEIKRQVGTGMCVGNLMAVGRAMQVHAIDHGTYPEQLLNLRTVLKRPEKLWCSGDTNRTAATNWSGTTLDNISFELLQPNGTEDENQQRAVMRCPVHSHEWWGDGSVHLSGGRVIKPQ
jgi:hypothetical protein